MDVDLWGKVRTRAGVLDLGTSMDAASRQTRQRVSIVKVLVLALHADHPEGLTDEELVSAFEQYRTANPAVAPASPQSLRTRRAEATREGRLRDSGRRRLTAFGSAAAVWQLAE